VDKRFFSAAAYCLAGSVLGFIGLIHAEQVGWNVGGQIALGYAFAGVLLLVFGLVQRGRAAGPTGEPTGEPAGIPEARKPAEPVTDGVTA